MLLSLSTVISTAGIVADSTATVIGAMIVAPLMTPILGTAVSIVLSDRRQNLHNTALVLAGAATVVAIAFLLGLLVQQDVVSQTNSQVATRVSPRLIDLVAALATGLVGGFALLREDVSDTLPGVAIAISLVPPLAVAGLTMESGAWGQALGALLLFGTNVAAIIATGTALMLAFRLRDAAETAGRRIGRLRGRTLVAVIAMVLLVAIPLGVGSRHVLQEQLIIAKADPVARKWATDQGWRVTDVSYRQDELPVVALGLPPEADESTLRSALDENGLGSVDLQMTLVVGGNRSLPGDG